MAIHFAVRRIEYDQGRRRVRKPACGQSDLYVELTSTRAQVTCKRCLAYLQRQLVKKGGQIFGVPQKSVPKKSSRPTAWDHLDNIPDDGEATPIPPPTTPDPLEERLAMLLYIHMLELSSTKGTAELVERARRLEYDYPYEDDSEEVPHRVDKKVMARARQLANKLMSA